MTTQEQWAESHNQEPCTGCGKLSITHHHDEDEAPVYVCESCNKIWGIAFRAGWVQATWEANEE